jgi:hypothetical protein
MNSELGKNGKDTVAFDWFRPPESKTLRLMWWDYAWKRPHPRGGSRRRRRALEGCPKPPYIGWRALGYKSVSIYPSRLQYGRLIRTALNYPDYLVFYSKLSSCPLAHTSGRAGPTDRSAGLLVGRACLSGTAETLVVGDPWVPMSHKPPINV